MAREIEAGRAWLAAHLCFGNMLGRPLARRTYRPVLEQAPAFHVDELVLEWANREMTELEVAADVAAAGRHLSAGVVDVKSYHVESAEEIAERIEQVLAAGVPERGLSLVPDCGFSQTARWATKPLCLGLGAGFVFDLYLFADALLFGRNATRVYAASSNPLAPGQESEPNAASAAFLAWWDRHYEAIAAFEPEYQRLNEIMKWSLVVSWLAQRDSLDRLGFLGRRMHELYKRAGRQKILRAERLASQAAGVARGPPDPPREGDSPPRISQRGRQTRASDGLMSGHRPKPRRHW